jgi:hypothetical protein
MKSILIAFSLIISYTIAIAQQNYDASLIPKELLPYASAVLRDEEQNIVVEDFDNILVHFKTVVTILNKNGDHMAHINLEHDKSTIIKYVKGAIYNQFGKQTGKFSEGDFEDASAWDGFSLFTDIRIKHYFPSVTEYPYTIVYEYELHLKQSLALPQWEPVLNFGIAVEKSSFTLSCKRNFNVRYRETNIPEKVSMMSDSRNSKIYTWSISNLKAVKDEPFSPYDKNYLPNVEIVPEKFSYYGFEGSFANWKELGKWMNDKLIVNRQELPAETVEHIKELTNDISDPKLKAKKIYEFMQAKTHYVSIQVGIGGIQPFLAADVNKQNYGDCKALVNYTQALLKAINIDSYYCVVESGRKYKVSLLKDFASIEQGDHIILCLPFKNDTTWADCTSQTIPFGYLGSFTDDRNVLACTPDGGKLMHTPKYTHKDNLESRKANFIINEAGELSGIMTTTFKGTDYEDRDELINEPVKEQYKMLQKIYPINNLDILNLEVKQDKSFDPVTTENIKLHARDYASLTDGKYYFMLNPVNRKTDVPKQVFNRLNDVYINRGYTKEDEVTFTVPANYHLDKTPLNDIIDKPFAKFTSTMELKGNQLIYKRKLQLIDGTYSKDTYQDFVDFFQEVVDGDSYTVVLVKNN